MPSTRTIRNLTEAWPDDPANFELQAFAASLADDRPVLSPPALDRIEAQLLRELDRRQTPPPTRPSRPMRIAGRVAGYVTPAGRMLAPYAAAACLLIGAGVWLTGGSVAPTIPIVPGPPEGTLITNQPPEWQAPTPEDEARIPRPAPTGG